MRAVDYLRVSTEEQKKGYGVARQSRKATRHITCTVRAWHATNGLGVPAAPLSDEEWARIAPLLPKGRRGTVRRSVDAIFCKARTGKSRPDVIKETGATVQASKHFDAWTRDDTWSCVNAALTDVEQVPLPEIRLLPSMVVEGRVR
ncbi:transposase [Streptomyces vietnamensis]|uniref:Insertion element IS402-like domain-containing protein n=1 Tax=Streptomyces vietnamensis TaxID=362257 RepID=A0A0B5I8D9_9ACTN|nr:transposase [Streptomyces vietnamensis]AJF66732.1 hypothetical protein SVTN_22515 [Streptomyces vietnamensis]